jgi:hypothetical protein
VAFRICLPSQLTAIHDVFHVSQLKKCIKVPTEIVEAQAIKIEPDLSYTEQPIQILDTKERVTRRKKIKMYKSYGIITPKKKRLGKPNLTFNEISQTSFKPIPKSNRPIPFCFRISGRDSF